MRIEISTDEKTEALMKITIFSFLALMVFASPHAVHADSSLEFRNTLQKEVALYILQASKVYAKSAIASEEVLKAVYTKIIPNWKCPSAFSEDLQTQVPEMYSCTATVTANMLELSKSSPHTITSADGVLYRFTDSQIGDQVSPFVQNLQQNYPDAKLNTTTLILNLKRLNLILATSSRFDFHSNFADDRMWNADKDAALFMDKYFPLVR